MVRPRSGEYSGEYCPPLEKSCVRPWVEISDVLPLEAACPTSRFLALISQPILRPDSETRNNITMYICLCINMTQMTV